MPASWLAVVRQIVGCVVATAAKATDVGIYFDSVGAGNVLISDVLKNPRFAFTFLPGPLVLVLFGLLASRSALARAIINQPGRDPLARIVIRLIAGPLVFVAYKAAYALYQYFVLYTLLTSGSYSSSEDPNMLFWWGEVLLSGIPLLVLNAGDLLAGRRGGVLLWLNVTCGALSALLNVLNFCTALRVCREQRESGAGEPDKVLCELTAALERSVAAQPGLPLLAQPAAGAAQLPDPSEPSAFPRWLKVVLLFLGAVIVAGVLGLRRLGTHYSELLLVLSVTAVSAGGGLALLAVALALLRARQLRRFAKDKHRLRWQYTDAEWLAFQHALLHPKHGALAALSQRRAVQVAGAYLAYALFFLVAVALHQSAGAAACAALFLLGALSTLLLRLGGGALARRGQFGRQRRHRPVCCLSANGATVAGQFWAVAPLTVEQIALLPLPPHGVEAAVFLPKSPLMVPLALVVPREHRAAFCAVLKEFGCPVHHHAPPASPATPAAPAALAVSVQSP